MRGENRSGQTAKTLILVGLILDIIGVAILLLVGLVSLIVPVLGAVILGFALIGLVWIVLVWMFSYARVREGDYEGGRTPTLVFAILSLITLAIIPGVLYLIAYVKLGDAAQAAATPAPAWSATPAVPAFAPAVGPLPSAGPAGKVCAHCGRTNASTSNFCEGCGAPL